MTTIEATPNESTQVQLNGNGTITLHEKGDIANIMSKNGTHPPAHSMRGFDPEFRDIVDYIIKITHRIWDEKALGTLYDYYQHNCVVHTSSGDIYGRDAVIAATIQALAAFPDRRLFGDEVIWGGDDVQGFYTSHRLMHEGTNMGATAYGEATGRKIQYRAIADCLNLENRIFEEWLVRDEILLIKQLGFDPHAVAKEAALAVAEGGMGYTIAGGSERLQGQLPPRNYQPMGDEIEDFVRRAIHEVWNVRLLNKVDEYYNPSFVCDSSSGRRMYGLGNFKAYILSLMSPFPDLSITVDNFCVVGDAETGYRTATRWTMLGTHTGPGIYGKPTGNPICVMGMSHHIIKANQFQTEYTLFDEFALLKQLYTPA